MKMYGWVGRFGPSKKDYLTKEHKHTKKWFHSFIHTRNEEQKQQRQQQNQIITWNYYIMMACRLASCNQVIFIEFTTTNLFRLLV